MTKEKAVELILNELERAEKLKNKWPPCMARRAGYVCEESMELLQASNDYEDYYFETPMQEKNESIEKKEKIQTEAIQVGAMAIRFLINL